jgi:integrase
MIKNYGIYQTLITQLDKLRKHNRQGSYKTKERYYQAMQRFCQYLADEWRLQKLSNIAPKHIQAYAEHLKQNNKSASTIKTDLSAIRFFHDRMSEPRHQLPDNSTLSLQRRKFLGFDRTWSDEEFNLMLGYAMEQNSPDYACAMRLAYYMGLRIHECCKIDRAMAEKALRSGFLIVVDIEVKGKNGKIRKVPLAEPIKIEFQNRLKVTPRGEKLLVMHDEATHSYIKDLQKFIRENRDRLPPREDKETLTFHGLRHSYAAEKFDGFIKSGMTPWQSKKAVSNLIGHERGDVTSIYLANENKETNKKSQEEK